MRIRLRVPTDGEVKSDGIRGWFRRLCGISIDGAPDGPLFSACKLDKRWTARGSFRYFFEGRRCRYIDGKWQTEYVFSVFAAGEMRRIRVVLPEGPIASWERQHDRRMSEEDRLALARETMISLAESNRFPEETTVPEAAIADSPA